MSMLLSSTEITLQIHNLTFSFVLTVCLSTDVRVLWNQSLPEARVFASVMPSPHRSTALSACQHQVPFFRCIRFYKQGLLITSHLGSYCDLYCQKNGFCSGHTITVDCDSVARCDNPFLASCSFRNVGVHVTIDVSRPPTTHTFFHTKKTLMVRVCHVLKPLSCEAWVKVLFRRHLYSNSSTGLEKSAQGVWNTPPSPIFGSQIPLLEVGGKRSFLSFSIKLLETGVNYSVTRGFRTG
jgi:hypothetical protein